MADPLTLYTYFRSSAAYRVRIALNLKGLKPDYRFVHLLKDGGQQHGETYKSINPQELVPTLIDHGHVIAQSLAIIEYLEDTHPDPPLLPKDAPGRARVRQLAYVVACDIHPVNNLRVLQHLKRLGIDEDQRTDWQKHWIAIGFEAIETLLAQSTDTGVWCHGNLPTLADICLIPQLANARRVNLDLAPYPTLTRIEQTALAHPAFAAAQPKEQPDAE
ncbi:MAG TPA: maleylacetoacetate isomerase [Rhizomicrobium sp.]|nr:maleylacetoacetate isomerase [Rhizomicrobium sp.]